MQLPLPPRRSVTSHFPSHFEAVNAGFCNLFASIPATSVNDDPFPSVRNAAQRCDFGGHCRVASPANGAERPASEQFPRTLSGATSPVISLSRKTMITALSAVTLASGAAHSIHEDGHALGPSHRPVRASASHQRFCVSCISSSIRGGWQTSPLWNAPYSPCLGRDLTSLFHRRHNPSLSTLSYFA